MNDNKLQQAASLYKQGNKPQAAILLEEIVRQNPNNSDAWYGLALSLDDPEKKIFYLKKILSLEPSHQKAHQLLEKLQPRRNFFSSIPFREPLFGLAWLLFLICMFLPQGGFGFGGYSTGEIMVFNGLGLAVLSIGGFPFVILILIYSLINPSTIFAFPIPLAFAVLTSTLLFIVSPFILRWTRSSLKKTDKVWLIYASLNFVSTMLFLLVILTMPVVGHIGPNDEGNKLLLGFIVWTSAQIMLTGAAFTKLFKW